MPEFDDYSPEYAAIATLAETPEAQIEEAVETEIHKVEAKAAGISKDILIEILAAIIVALVLHILHFA